MKSVIAEDLSQRCYICYGTMHYSSARKKNVCDNCGFQDKSF